MFGKRFAKMSGALAVMAGIGCLSGCMSPALESRLHAIELRQDSILAILHSQQDKNDFVAQRLGYRPPADTAVKSIPVGNSFTRGPENAALTLVEFSDLQCPYCAMLAQPFWTSVSRAYPNDVRLVYKNFPLSFHPQSRAAAAAAIAAGKQGKFYEFRFLAASHFRELGDSLYIALAQQLGLDVERFKKDMKLTPEIDDVLNEDEALGQRVGVEGTPTVYANGRLVEDRSFNYYSSLVMAAKSKQ